MPYSKYYWDRGATVIQKVVHKWNLRDVQKHVKEHVKEHNITISRAYWAATARWLDGM